MPQLYTTTDEPLDGHSPSSHAQRD